MSAVRPPQVPGATYPRHPSDHLHRFINDDLNVKYNLGVLIPPSDASPFERKKQETLATKIYVRLQVHFYQGGLEALRQLTTEFDLEARQSCSQWVEKPRGDPNTLPVSTSCLLASNQAQRECLQAIFYKVLGRNQPKRALGRTQSGPAAFSMEKSASVQPKRAAQAEATTAPTKRSRTTGQAANAAQVPSPAAPAAPGNLFAARANASGGYRHGSTRTERSHLESFEQLKRSTSYSTSMSSNDSSRALFSYANLGSSTQETVEASSQERTRAFPSSQYLDPTSTTADALHTSFTDHEAALGSRLRDTRLKNAPSSLAQATEYLRPAIRPFSETGFLQSPRELPVFRDASAPQAGSILGQGIWPALPDWLQPAPFHVAWEVLRIGTHLGVDLCSAQLTYDPQWKDQKALRSAVGQAFRGKPLPAASDPEAWATATSSASGRNQHVVFTASLEFSNVKSDSLRLKLHPLRLDKPHRLGRKYGADRFLELLVPSPDSSNLPWFLKDRPFDEELVGWLTQYPHEFCGRHYRPFYTKDGGQRKPVRNLQFGPDPKPVYTDRVFFFAEGGVDITRNKQPHTTVASMVMWALDLKGGKNDSQPVLKLFQRQALVLSRTMPTISMEPHQIRNRTQDLLSADVKRVMNDGVGRMSRKVAKLVQAALGLSSPPCAIQCRIGSAKGMLTVDGTDTTEEIWVEIFPSQRKWDLDLNAADQEHRTLEIRSWAPEKLRSASLNLQFLPVLEDRAVDKEAMRGTISRLLEDSLRHELSEQRESLDSPIQFQKWVSAHSAHRSERFVRGYVPFQGGLPREEEEIMSYLLNAGFDPWKNKFLNDMAYEAQFQSCERLKKKLNIKIGCSTYLFMVADFQGALEEDEVHIAFSDRFRSDTGDWEGTMVHGVDVLVARSPAHFTSDIQRVKAIFRPELAHLQNIIVFSAKGKIPLADKLSGGDYDGDQCLVIWDERVVENFANAGDAVQPDLRSHYRQDHVKLRQLMSTHKEDYEAAICEMMDKSFAFNLRKNMLGPATSYKERLCYSRGNIHDEMARALSALLSALVDAPKQGIEFDAKDFKAFKKAFHMPDQLEEPLYETEQQPRDSKYAHIIDHLKFTVARPIIEEELAKFYEDKKKTKQVVYWDKDLTERYYDKWADEASTDDSARTLLRCLKRDIDQVLNEWNTLCNSMNFPEMVQQTYNSWQGILPSNAVPEATLRRLHRGYEHTSEWTLLKASTTFKFYYQSKTRFVWQMAGSSLCFIKSQAVTERKAAPGRMPTAMTPEMYVIHKVDSRAVTSLVGLRADLGVDGDDEGAGEDDL